eukprot:CAMPEP_0176440900 /NCGR_PEP_ID=MMETSP0127-20121128/20862_1 /TAXON_ID=938130 /ORGANISM="Platyophrya macrostoma, Strain WH" /LENGTH=250 /DNA_ID=CAMNT_0017825545 /DNA_START=162 /DNA_END=914 /DNA_ORIENTATION=+
MRRTQSRLLDYWVFGATSRAQAYTRGDCIPRTYNIDHPVTAASSDAAALTGNQNNVAYTTETMFDGQLAVAAEVNHFKTHKGVFNFVVPVLASGEGATAYKVVLSFLDIQADIDRLFWERLFKDFPALQKPFTEAKKAEFLKFFQSTMEVVDDEAAVTAIGGPFVLQQWQEAFITPAMQWRIAEKFADAVEIHATSVNRYERRAMREALERVMKISHNVISQQPWAHEQITNPITSDINSFRAWHEAGNW